MKLNVLTEIKVNDKEDEVYAVIAQLKEEELEVEAEAETTEEVTAEPEAKTE